MSAKKKKSFKIIIVICIWCILILLFLKAFTNTDKMNYSDINVNPTEYDLYEAELLNFSIDNDIETFSSSNPGPNKTELSKLLLQELPNVAFDYWYLKEKSTLQLTSNCSKFASPLELQFYNTYWQVLRIQDLTVRIFGAYYDNRESVLSPVIRLLVMSDYTDDKKVLKSYCQLWFEERNTPTIVHVLEYRLIWFMNWGHKPGMFYPYLVTCVLPPTSKSLIPKTVSLVAEQCDKATNNLKVNYEVPLYQYNNTGPRFAVCVKGLEFPYEDISFRLVEWLETMRVLGAEHIYTYDLAVHPNVLKVLDYYKEQGFVKVYPLTLATGQPRLQHYQHLSIKSNRLMKRLNEIIPYNDCFYRNLYKYDYIALLDIDEVIMPLGNLTSWADLIKVAVEYQQQTKGKCPFGYSSICFLNVHFPNLSQLPSKYPFAYMMDHTQRNINHSRTNEATKCLHNTSEVLTLHNHFSLAKLKSCKPLSVNKTEAQMQHYHTEQLSIPLSNLVEDRSIWRFSDRLLRNIVQVLRDLNFLNSS